MTPAEPDHYVYEGYTGAIVPEEAERLANLRESWRLAACREMANVREREAEAHEWSEGLIGAHPVWRSDV